MTHAILKVNFPCQIPYLEENFCEKALRQQRPWLPRWHLSLMSLLQPAANNE